MKWKLGCVPVCWWTEYDLAGERAWRDDSPHLVVTPPMSLEKGAEDNFVSSVRELSSCCDVAMSKAQVDDKSESKNMVSKSLKIPSILSVSHDDLKMEQKSDSTLNEFELFLMAL